VREFRESVMFSLSPFLNLLFLHHSIPPLSSHQTQDLADKIAQLNSAIDDVSAQLRAQDLAAAGAGVESGAVEA
jgi:hypothetical protein